MNRDDEILQLLREIRDTQVRNREEWLEVVRRNEQQYISNIAKAKRTSWLLIGVLIIIFLGICYIPSLLTPKQILPDFSELYQYSNTVATPIFDGSYVVDSEKLLECLRSRQGQDGPKERNSEKQLLAMLEDQFYNFQINHGVITSGKVLIQEFRITSADIEDGKLRGRAVWHEDVHDPGDCSLINVHLSLEGDVLKFWYFPDGEEKGEPVILNRTQP